MNEQIFKILLIGTICFNPTLARPDQLQQQRYEFQEFHTSASHDQISSIPENARHDVAPIPVQHEPILWSQQHQNEVNAFAEMFRQNFNQMIAQHNQMMQMHHHSLASSFIPVTYELYHVPDEIMWKNYFGKQQQYVHDKTEQMSRQLIQSLEQGRVSPQDLMNPNFFLAQAANELNRVHQVQNEFESNDQQVASSFAYQQHQYDSFNAQHQQQQHHQQQQQQQQQHQIFSESIHNQETMGTNQVLVYNQETGEYQYVTVVAAPEVPAHEELAGAMVSNANVQHTSVNDEMLKRFREEVAKIEVHTPVSVETPRLAQQHFNNEVQVSTQMPLQTTTDEFYGSTYDQQPIYDLQFVESVSSTVRPSVLNIMSLVRNRTKVKASTTTNEPSTTTSTTTELPTTESSIMSMLPNKKPSLNYTEIYQHVRAELDRQMQQISNNKSEETHFMGMTSNVDQAKLSYETVTDGKDHKQLRGDQPSKSDDYISEEYVESEPGVGYYSVNTEPQLVVPTISVDPSSTPSHIPPTSKPTKPYQNPYYNAPLAPFPTTTIKSTNPYYSASLAPFPDEVFQAPENTTQLQIKASEVADMSQQTQVIDDPNGSHFAVAGTIQEFNEQQYDDTILDSSEFRISHDMQQHENVQQRYIDIGGGHNIEGQRYEKQLPPEQSYRNPDLQHSFFGHDHKSDIPAHVQQITEPSARVDNKTPKNNWFQRQFSKLKNVF